MKVDENDANIQPEKSSMPALLRIGRLREDEKTAVISLAFIME